MSTQTHSHKVKAYIKMLAAHKHMTISKYFLSMAKEEMTNKPKKIPNKKTRETINFFQNLKVIKHKDSKARRNLQDAIYDS